MLGHSCGIEGATAAQHLTLFLSPPPAPPPSSVTPLLRRELAGVQRGEGALLRDGVVLYDIRQALDVSHGIQTVSYDTIYEMYAI